jgi:hypothetical protein
MRAFSSQFRLRNSRINILGIAAVRLFFLISLPGGCTGNQGMSRTSDGGDGGNGRYTQGVYQCCARGEGTGCCVGLPQGTCFQYGGTAGDCTPEGDSLEAKDICSICCPGLSRIESSQPGGGSSSMTCNPGIPSVFVCARCGDGICGLGENQCNCAADCK